MNHANVLTDKRFAYARVGAGLPSQPSESNRCPNRVHARAKMAKPVFCNGRNGSVGYSEVVEQSLVVVLCREAGVAQILAYGGPLLQAAVVEHLEVVGDDEGNDAGRQALLEHHETSDAAVAVLKRVDTFETLVQVEYIVERLAPPGVIFRKETLHFVVYLLRRSGLHAAHLVGQALVVAHGEPLLAAVRRAGLELCVQFLDEGFGKRFSGPVDDHVDAAEVIGGFENIVHTQRIALDAHRVGLEDMARLVMGQTAALDVVRVVGEVYLRAVVDAALETHRLLLAQHLQKRHDTLRAGLTPGQCGIRRNVPGLARKKCSLDFSRGAVVADGALRDTVLCGECRD